MYIIYSIVISKFVSSMSKLCRILYIEFVFPNVWTHLYIEILRLLYSILNVWAHYRRNLWTHLYIKMRLLYRILNLWPYFILDLWTLCILNLWAYRALHHSLSPVGHSSHWWVCLPIETISKKGKSSEIFIAASILEQLRKGLFHWIRVFYKMWLNFTRHRLKIQNKVYEVVSTKETALLRKSISLAQHGWFDWLHVVEYKCFLPADAWIKTVAARSWAAPATAAGTIRPLGFHQNTNHAPPALCSWWTEQ